MWVIARLLQYSLTLRRNSPCFKYTANVPVIGLLIAMLLVVGMPSSGIAAVPRDNQTSSPSSVGAAKNALCERGTRNLAELVEEQQRENPYSLTLKQFEEKTRFDPLYPRSNRVPSDVEIVPVKVRLVIVRTTEVKNFPDSASGASFGLRPYYNEASAICRVKTPSNVSWYVLRDSHDGSLGYVLQGDALPEAEYKKMMELEEKNWREQKNKQ